MLGSNTSSLPYSMAITKATFHRRHERRRQAPRPSSTFYVGNVLYRTQYVWVDGNREKISYPCGKYTLSKIEEASREKLEHFEESSCITEEQVLVEKTSLTEKCVEALKELSIE
jgi:hypothetical protein